MISFRTFSTSVDRPLFCLVLAICCQFPPVVFFISQVKPTWTGKINCSQNRFSIFFGTFSISGNTHPFCLLLEIWCQFLPVVSFISLVKFTRTGKVNCSQNRFFFLFSTFSNCRDRPLFCLLLAILCLFLPVISFISYKGDQLSFRNVWLSTFHTQQCIESLLGRYFVLSYLLI